MRIVTDNFETEEVAVVLAWTNREHDDTIEVGVWLSTDGVPVVQIDTPEGLGRLRVRVNDGNVYDDDPDVPAESAKALAAALLGMKYDTNVAVFGPRLAKELDRMGYQVVKS